MENLDLYKKIAIEQGIDEAITIVPNQVAFDFRATYKCMTCPKYGKVPTCPPNIPDTDYFRRLIKCYNYGLLLVKKYRYTNTKQYEKYRAESGPRLQEILLFLEQQAFERNNYWAISFTGGSCRMCKCTQEEYCKTPEKGRSAMEAIGIDVIKTCANFGVQIDSFPHPHKEGTLYRVGLFLL